MKIMELKSIYESPQKDRNEEKFGVTENSCVCCGKPTDGSLWVHMTTDWKAVPNGTTEEDLAKVGMESQGCFPVGTTCSKKIGNKFVSKS